MSSIINPGDLQVQCTRCRNAHLESERKSVYSGKGFNNLVCPRCGGKSYYDLTPQAAWCWSSGLIETGDNSAVPDGSIAIAHGPKSSLRVVLGVVSRHGHGASDGKLLVPGVPEADTQQEKGDALAKWLKWCAGGNGKKGRHGVLFISETSAQLTGTPS